jgi:ABC-type dipeptide/oligopeptide/nickel transport system permease component
LYVFAFQLKLFPLGGHGSLAHLVLPTLAVALPWSVMFGVGNLMADLVAARLDPRIRLTI